MLQQSVAWVTPLEAAAQAASQETHWALLYSGQRLSFSGRFSYLCLFPQETLSGNRFDALSSKLTETASPFSNAWFGYLGYEMLHECEECPRLPPSFIPLPAMHWMRFGLILQFDHDSKSLTAYHEPHVSIPSWLHAPRGVAQALPEVSCLASTMSRRQYLEAVALTKEAIARGDFYQANITRKFTGEFAALPDAYTLFTRLCEVSPATYSAFIRMGEHTVCSSSPERFLTIDVTGRMESRPIKGTAPRHADATQDAAQRNRLHLSGKDRAENLMIVDLMRNDLARSCIPGSIKVDNLFEVSSYATLHHMASTISGQKRDKVVTLEAVKHCFPPGSMTGAPKVRAIRWCGTQEGIQRGIYSGALGWFGGDGSCDLSVVIRTLVLEGKRFEFQVGGGIVADSDPESEWRETLTKARGIAAALGIHIQQVEAL